MCRTCVDQPHHRKMPQSSHRVMACAPYYDRADMLYMPKIAYAVSSPPPPLIRLPHRGRDFGFEFDSRSTSSPTSSSSLSPSYSHHDQELDSMSGHVHSMDVSSISLGPSAGGKSSRGSAPVQLPCAVCGDGAPDHMHYGGIACFSCRAFFRRSVAKAHTYVCPEMKECGIDVTTRRNCQYCRYQKCLRSGMKPSWVLTEQEKRERIIRKRAKASSTSNSLSSSGSSWGSPMSASSAMNYAKLPSVAMTNEEESRLEELLFAQESTRHTVTLPTYVVNKIAELTRTPQNQMEHTTTLELYRVLYSRVVKFAGFVDEFADLMPEDRRLLLSKNLEPMANIRTVQCFSSENKVTTAHLQELGRPDVAFGAHPVRLNQFFVVPWAADQAHADMFCQTMTGLAKLPALDAKSIVLFQLVALFSTMDIDVKQLKEPGKIDRYQEQMTLMLLRYLRMKLGYTQANPALHKYLGYLHELRILSDKIVQHRPN